MWTIVVIYRSCSLFLIASAHPLVEHPIVNHFVTLFPPIIEGNGCDFHMIHLNATRTSSANVGDYKSRERQFAVLEKERSGVWSDDGGGFECHEISDLNLIVFPLRNGPNAGILSDIFPRLCLESIAMESTLSERMNVILQYRLRLSSQSDFTAFDSEHFELICNNHLRLLKNLHLVEALQSSRRIMVSPWLLNLAIRPSS